MALSAFDHTSGQPTEPALRAVLGRSFAAWQDLQARVAESCPPIAPVWACSGAKAGWGLRLKRRDRIVLYMTPCKGYFLVSFALGEKAVRAARGQDLPAEMLARIDAAPRYPEGRGVRFEVRTAAAVEPLVQLAGIKLAN